MAAAREGILRRWRDSMITRDASDACRSAAVTPFAVIGSTMAAASPAISQFTPATLPCMRQTKEVTDGEMVGIDCRRLSKRGNRPSFSLKISSTVCPSWRLPLMVSPVATYPTLMVSGLIGISHTHSIYGGLTPSGYSVVPSLGVVPGNYPQVASFRGPDPSAGNRNARANKPAAPPEASINQGEEIVLP